MADEKLRLRGTNPESQLGAAGLTDISVIKQGDPKHLLCAETEIRGAYCIFIGAKKHGRLDRFLLGSVSTAVAARSLLSRNRALLTQLVERLLYSQFD